MNGQMMDFQLTLPTILRRAETYFGAQRDRHAAARQELPSLHVRRRVPTLARARGRAARPRARARRPRRDAVLEPLPAPRGVPRHPVRRLRPPHAQPAAAPERPRVHRDARRRPRRDRRPEPQAAARPVRRPDEDRARDRGRGRLRGAARRRRSGRVARPRARRERGGGDVLHERHDRDAERRRLLAPLDDAAHARRRRRQPDGARHLRDRRDPARRADVPRERVGLSVSRNDDRREARLSRAAPRPGEPARRVRVRGRDVDGGRADDLDRASSRCSTPSPSAGTSRT